MNLICQYKNKTFQVNILNFEDPAYATPTDEGVCTLSRSIRTIHLPFLECDLSLWNGFEWITSYICMDAFRIYIN